MIMILSCIINTYIQHTLMNIYRHSMVLSDYKYFNFVWTHLNLSWGETIWCCFMCDVLNVQTGTPI